MLKSLLIITMALLLASCSSTPAPTPLTPEQQFCSDAIRLLNSPNLSFHTKEALLEKARNRGCLR